MLTSGALCKGYGGLEMAAEMLFGPMEQLWYAEFDPATTASGKPVPQYAAQVCAAHWPEVPNLGDLTTVDWSNVPQVDVLTAGFPCTDVSAAGKRAGLVGDHVIPAGEMPCGCQWGDHTAATCEAASPSGMVPARLTGGGDLASADAAVAELNARDLTSDGPPPERVVKGTRTGIWSHIAGAIKALQPKLVLLENVEGLLSGRSDSDVEPCPWCLGDTPPDLVVRALGAVLADLAALGFDAEWVTVPASDVGAPHRRKRVFIAAWPAADAAGVGHGNAGTSGFGGFPSAPLAGAAGVGADGVALLPTPKTSDAKREDCPAERARRLPSLVSVEALLPTPTSRDHKGHNQRGDETCLTGALLPTPRVAATRTGRSAILGSASSPSIDQALEIARGEVPRELRSLDEAPPSWKLLPTPNTGVSSNGHGRRGGSLGNGRQSGASIDALALILADTWGAYAPAIARWEAVTGRRAPSPTEPGTRGQQRLNPVFVEWLMGLPAGWVTDHVPRNGALKCLGNGVVPQQAAYAFGELLLSAGLIEVAA